jgi:hypothetical protein
MEKGISTLILDLCETTPKQIIQQCGLFLLHMLNVDVCLTFIFLKVLS